MTAKVKPLAEKGRLSPRTLAGGRNGKLKHTH